MKKEKEFVLNQIKKAIVSEELAIPLYVSHITQSFFWSGLNQDKQKKIIKGLKQLEKDSKKHVLLLQKIQAIYLKSLKK